MSHVFTSTLRLAADRAEVLAVILAVDDYPTWLEGMREVEVQRSQSDGRPAQVRFAVETPLAPLTYTVAYDYPDDDTIQWSLVEGQALRALTGEYRLSGDDGAVQLDARLELEPSLPLPASVVRQVGQSVIDRAVSGLQRRVAAGEQDRPAS